MSRAPGISVAKAYALTPMGDRGDRRGGRDRTFGSRRAHIGLGRLGDRVQAVAVRDAFELGFAGVGEHEAAAGDEVLYGLGHQDL